MRASRSILATLLLAAALPGAAAGQTYEYVVRRGADTLATELVARALGGVSGQLTLRQGPTIGYSVALSPDESVNRLELRITPPGATQVQRVLMAFMPETVYVQTPVPDSARMDVQRFPGRPGMVAFLNLSVGSLEQIVRRARVLGGERAEVPLFIVGPGSTLTAEVAGAPGEEVVVTVAGVAARLLIDEEGRMLGGVVDGQGVVWERTDPPGRLPAGAAASERPDYSAPPGAPYTAEEVTVRTPAGHVLTGTLTLPRDARGRVPAVVLVSGSGSQDRDAATPAIPGYRFFRQVADTLGRSGIAVLRLDDRGVGGSGGVTDSLTTAHLADDTRAALAYLRTRREVDPRRLAVAGHSEGALIAPMAAEGDPSVRAVVLMAGQAWTGRRINAFQNREVLERTGSTPAQVDSFMATLPAKQDSLGAAIPWFRFFLDYDPLPAARRLRVPVLVLHGATDLQVPSAHARELEAAIRAGGNREVLSIVFPGLNHLFLHDPTGTPDPAAYAALPSKEVPREVLGALANWLAGRLLR